MPAAADERAGWLFKEEPDHYSYADLERDGSTVWDGVDNNLARKNLRQVRKGDRAFFYHTGKEKAIVGEIRIVSDPMPDPDSADPKAVVVKVKPVKRFAASLTLERVKKDALLSSWDLVRLPRLSVMPVNRKQWERVEALIAEQKST